MRNRINFFIQSIIAVIKCNGWIILNRKLPDYVLWTAGGIGDYFLLAAVIKSLPGKNIWINSPYTDLFKNNPDVHLSVKVFSRYCCLLWQKKILSRVKSIPSEDHPVSKETGLPIHFIHNRIASLGLSYNSNTVDTPTLYLTSK